MGKIRDDITGKEYYYWTVLNFYDIIGNGNARFLCKCVCGKKKIVRGYALKSGNSQSCGCQKKIPANKYHKQWSGYGNISGGFYSRIKYRAKKDHIFFDISVEDIWNKFLQQNGLCALTNRPIFFGKTNNCEHTASLDRIDSNQGYILSNIQWVHKDLNLMKLDYNIEEFTNACYDVVNKKQSEIQHPLEWE